MSEAWATHPVCVACYVALNPDLETISVGEIITRPVTELVECCYCGQDVSGFILMRAAVAGMPHCTMPWAEAE